MKTILRVGVAALLLAGAGCHRSGSMQREQQQYDVVQEGDASGGVTSTLNAPGETATNTTPLTNTNVDTTTAFAGFGNGAPLPTAQPGSTFAPPDYSRDVAARPAPAPRVQTPPPMTSAAPPRPEPTNTAPPAPPPQTDTTATTSTTSTQPQTDTEPPPKTDTQQTDTQEQEEPPQPQPPAPQPPL